MKHFTRLFPKAALGTLLFTAPMRETSHAIEIPGAGSLADLIMRFDSNGDSKIDTGEWQMGMAMGFEDIDADRDGKITAGEIDSLSEPLEKEVGQIVGTLVPKLIKPLLLSMDADKDGAVSREEFTKQAAGIFPKLDADKDAQLTRAEVIELPVKILALSGK